MHAGNERANLTRSPQSRAPDRVSAIFFTTSLHFALAPCGRIRDAYNFNVLKMERNCIIPRSAICIQSGGGNSPAHTCVRDILSLSTFKSFDES